jgi:uncharacterized protein YjaG (DUF416 family)
MTTSRSYGATRQALQDDPSQLGDRAFYGLKPLVDGLESLIEAIQTLLHRAESLLEVAPHVLDSSLNTIEPYLDAIQPSLDAIEPHLKRRHVSGQEIHVGYWRRRVDHSLALRRRARQAARPLQEGPKTEYAVLARRR